MKAKYKKIIDIEYEDCTTGVCGYLMYRVDSDSGRKSRRYRDHIGFPGYIHRTQRERYVTAMVKKNRGIQNFIIK